MHTFMLLMWGLASGAAHAFEVDHMTAVSTFVAKRPSPRQAVKFGIQWSIGHGLSLLLLGSILFALKATMKITMSETVAGSLQRVVGLALFGLGLWTLLQVRPGQLHHSHAAVYSHDHLHSHDGPHVHDHTNREAVEAVHTHSHPHTHDGRGSLWMGVLHGLAGTAGFVGEGVVALSQSYAFVVVYTLTFSLGVLAAMSFYAGILGGAISWGGHRSHTFLHFARGLSGLCACVVGLMWMLNWKPFSH